MTKGVESIAGTMSFLKALCICISPFGTFLRNHSISSYTMWSKGARKTVSDTANIFLSSSILSILTLLPEGPSPRACNNEHTSLLTNADPCLINAYVLKEENNSSNSTNTRIVRARGCEENFHSSSLFFNKIHNKFSM